MVAIAGPGWRLAGCLAQLLDDADRFAPRRSRRSDGTIGDRAHQSRHSDHNPDSGGNVCGLDLTNDPSGGFDAWQVAQTIARNIVAGTERRVVYLISGDPTIAGDLIFHQVGTIWRWDPHPYTGGTHNGHHLHVSCVHGLPEREDRSRWQLSTPIPPTTERKFEMDLIKSPTVGPAVTDWQTKRLLGPKTLAAYQDAQTAVYGRPQPVVTVTQEVFDSIPTTN